MGQYRTFGWEIPGAGEKPAIFCAIDRQRFRSVNTVSDADRTAIPNAVADDRF